MQKKLIMPLVFFLILIVVWQALVVGLAIDKWLLPAPLEVLKALWSRGELLLSHTVQTVLEASLGFGLAVVIAFMLSVAMVTWPRLKQGLYPILVMSQTIPTISIYPLLTVWFGYGVLPKIMVVALVCFFPIVISLVDGMEGVELELLEWMQAMGARPGQILWKLRLPAALPSFFSGLKVAATYSIMGAVIGEWMGASKGLGVFITRAANSFMLDQVFAAILVITFLSVVLFGLIEIFARLLMPWYRQDSREGY